MTNPSLHDLTLASYRLSGATVDYRALIDIIEQLTKAVEDAEIGTSQDYLGAALELTYYSMVANFLAPAQVLLPTHEKERVMKVTRAASAALVLVHERFSDEAFWFSYKSAVMSILAAFQPKRVH